MTAANDFPWTEEKIATLKQLWNDGLTGSQIAAEMGGMSRNSVIGKAHRLGLEPRHETFNKKGRRKNTRPELRAPAKYNPPKLPSVFNPPFKAPNKIPPIAPLLAPEEKEYILGQGIPLLELAHDTCRYPLNSPGRTEYDAYRFCGDGCANLIDGKPADLIPYCPCHCRMAYQAPHGCRRKVYSRRDSSAEKAA